MSSIIFRSVLLPVFMIAAVVLLTSNDATAQSCQTYTDDFNFCLEVLVNTANDIAIQGGAAAGTGVAGYDTSTGTGVAGSSSSGIGVAGSSGAGSYSPSGYFGVYGYTPKSSGFGVVGSVTGLAPSPPNLSSTVGYPGAYPTAVPPFGVYGDGGATGTGVVGVNSNAGTGVFGQASGTGSGTGVGVQGVSGNEGGIGVAGTGFTIGVRGEVSSFNLGSTQSIGVSGLASYGWGGYFENQQGNGTQAQGANVGVVGTVTGLFPSGNAGVYGDGGSFATGVYGIATSRVAVYGNSGSNYAGYFTSPGTEETNPAALYGDATGSGGTGVRGTGYGYGVYGSSSSGYGVYGTTGGGNTAGVFGTSASNTSGDGVVGTVTNGWAGVAGVNYASGPGINGINYSSGYAGYFTATTGNGIYASTSSGTYAAVFAQNIEIAGSPYMPSDIRYKKNVTPLTGAVDRLLKLKGVTYEWKEPEKHGRATGVQLGFIAQDVEKVFPNWVLTDAEGFKTVSVTQLRH